MTETIMPVIVDLPMNHTTWDPLLLAHDLDEIEIMHFEWLIKSDCFVICNLIGRETLILTTFDHQTTHVHPLNSRNIAKHVVLAPFSGHNSARPVAERSEIVHSHVINRRFI